jgi:peptidyl-prolyl cis-trans isomerase B (cyclophilin B)
VYRTVGGTPFLDQNYTVFGKVTTGMAVVDSIAAVKVDQAGRPFENVYILSAEVVRDSTVVE